MMYSTKFNRIACLLIILMAGACASSPEYVPARDVDDYGHYSTRLDDDRYRVVYNGRPSMNPNTAKDYALLRAAELTLQEGNDWFQVVDRETSSIERYAPSTGFRYERAYYVERDCGLLSCRQSVRPTTMTSVGFDSRDTRSRHSHALEIVMGKGKMPTESGSYYDADSVARSLWESI